MPTTSEHLLWAETDTGRLLVDLRDARAHDLVAADGDLNPLSRRLWQHALDAHPWDLVVDVGVNYGEMLVGVELPPSARIMAFEPNPAVRSLLAQSLAAAGLEVELRAEAVAAEAGAARFALDPHWSGMSTLDIERASDGAELVDVEVTTLDAVLDAVLSPSGSFAVKVDVEGVEEQVLAGAERSLGRSEPWAVMLEVLHMPSGLLAALAARHALVMLDSATLRPTLVTADEVEEALVSGHVYPQDCLLVSPSLRPWLLD